jgi:hypothetical protein
MGKHRITAKRAVDALESEPDGTAALAMMLTGLSHGLEDVLALLAREINTRFAVDAPETGSTPP